MNQPKFRGFSKETNSWHYGFGWREVDYTDEFLKENGMDAQAVLYTENGPIECELLSMGQFTGEKLNDKEIYQGDIVQVNQLTFESSAPLPENLNVQYYAGMYQLFRDEQPLMGLHLAYLKDGSIIGTMYEKLERLAS